MRCPKCRFPFIPPTGLWPVIAAVFLGLVLGAAGTVGVLVATDQVDWGRAGGTRPQNRGPLAGPLSEADLAEEQREILAYIKANVGEPESVEVADWGKIQTDRKGSLWQTVKFRCIGPQGARVMNRWLIALSKEHKPTFHLDN